MIMEINNSFYEKRNFFFRLSTEQSIDTPESPEAKVLEVPARGSRELHQLRFLSSKPGSKTYKGSWEKQIFASPFEKVGGTMAASFADPLRPDSNPKGPLQSTLSSLTPDGKVKVTSRLSSWGQPVSPLSGSLWEIAKFLLRWTHVGVFSAYRIVKEALRVRFRGNLEYLQRPEVRRGSAPRKETEVEVYVYPFSFQKQIFQLTTSAMKGPRGGISRVPTSSHLTLSHALDCNLRAPEVVAF